MKENVVTERFIRTFHNKICKYLTSISNNDYIDKLAGIHDEYSNTYYGTIKMKPAAIKSNTLW